MALLKFGFQRKRDLTPWRAWSAIPTIFVAFVLLSGAESREWIVAGGCLAFGAIVYAVWKRTRAPTA
jgi:hypothetical protein